MVAALDIFKLDHVLAILCAHLSQSGETYTKVMSESSHSQDLKWLWELSDIEKL